MRIEPRASYRVQLHGDFDLDAAAGIVDYLARLGISHLYCSPLLQAAPGSTHGYDVVDPTRVSAELGGEPAHDRLCAVLAAKGLGRILDIVPNHMAAHAANPWWWDVLARGSKSPRAASFDIDWDPPEPRLRGRILLPVLGDHIGREIAAGTLRRVDDEVAYHEHRFPLRLGTSASLDLFALLDRQHYRLAWWRTAAHDLNYRRFFDIDGLVGVRVEDARVFAETHERILGWVEDGSLDGLRVDHPDGLRRPAEYLERLRSAAPEAWIVVEKILEADESLRPWPVDGTTGYDFIGQVGSLFVDASKEAAFDDLYRELTGESDDYAVVVERAKRCVLESLLDADVRRVAGRFVAVCETQPHWRDFTRRRLAEAITEIVVAFDVYRSYVDEQGQASEADVAVITRAVERAKSRRPDLGPDLFDFIQSVLLGRLAGDAATAARMQLQQLTGPAMAKGVEDTAFYRYLRFVALNEVGGAPDRFGAGGVEAFHAWAADVAHRWPRTMLALSTHDTKRSEDVRARLYVLSERPERWASSVRHWMARHDRVRRDDGRLDRNMEYLCYQTLVGAWPLTRDRALAYLEKASREAKRHTSWTDPDPEYDAALVDFVDALYADEGFLAELEELVGELLLPGRVTSLAQKLLQLTAPGVPDVYQGTELWDLSLVDPDNRRPVDYAQRRRLLDALPERAPSDLGARRDEGLAKLRVVREALALRAARPEAFGPEASYRPLRATAETNDDSSEDASDDISDPISAASAAPAAEHVVAFVRGEQVISVVPRLVVGLQARGGFRDTRLELPEGRWTDVLCGRSYTGGAVAVSRLLELFPVALLARQEEEAS